MNQPPFLVLMVIISYAFSPAAAGPLAVDTFDYDRGSLLAAQTGGHGWDTAWASIGATIADESISYAGDGFKKGGGPSLKIAMDGENVFSRKVSAVADRLGADYFVSFIFQIKSLSEAGEISGEVFTGWQCLDGKPDTKIDNIGFTGLHGQAGARVKSLSKLIKTPLQYGTTYFLVIKYGGWNGNEYTTTTVWLNPSSGDESVVDPLIRVKASADAGSSGFLGLQVRALGLSPGRYYLIDDVCVGSSWADVTTAPMTPVP